MLNKACNNTAKAQKNQQFYFNAMHKFNKNKYKIDNKIPIPNANIKKN